MQEVRVALHRTAKALGTIGGRSVLPPADEERAECWRAYRMISGMLAALEEIGEHEPTPEAVAAALTEAVKWAQKIRGLATTAAAPGECPKAEGRALRHEGRVLGLVLLALRLGLKPSLG
jgi:hypothetical protein